MMIPVPAKQASDLLFDMYQGHQKLIAARASAAIGSFWLSIIDPAYFSDTWTRFSPILRGIIDTHYQMSAADASNYYGLSRAVAGFVGPNVPGSDLAGGYLETITDKVGKGSFYRQIDSGKSVAAASEIARRGLMGTSVRVVLNGGRNTVTNAAAGDNVATGWERIVESGPCAYCAMHAASGGVRKEQSFSFRAHDYCTCLARVVFKGQSSANVGLSEEWGRTTVGKNGKDAVAAWNQYWSEKNGSNGNGSGGAEATPAPTAEGAGNAPVEDQPVGLA
jgi:hypothetical protein